MLKEIERKYKIKEKITSPAVIDTDPNYISLLALIFALEAGYLFYIGMNILGALFILLNGYLDMLDGEIAEKFSKKTRLGDLLDHTLDRIADIAVLLGISAGPYVPWWLGSITTIAVLLVSYMGTQHQALGEDRLYGGLFGRSDRIITIFLVGILSFFVPEALFYGICIILSFSIITFLQRFWLSIRMLKK